MKKIVQSVLLVMFICGSADLVFAKKQTSKRIEGRKFSLLTLEQQYKFVGDHVSFLAALEKHQNEAGVEYGYQGLPSGYEFVRNILMNDVQAAGAAVGPDCVYCLKMKSAIIGKRNAYDCPSPGTKNCSPPGGGSGKMAGFAGFEVCVPMTKTLTEQTCSSRAAEMYAEAIKNNDPAILKGIQENPVAFEEEIKSVQAFCENSNAAHIRYEEKIAKGGRTYQQEDAANKKAGIKPKLYTKKLLERLHVVSYDECQAYKKSLSEVQSYIANLRAEDSLKTAEENQRSVQFLNTDVRRYDDATKSCSDGQCCEEGFESTAGHLNKDRIAVHSVSLGDMISDFQGRIEKGENAQAIVDRIKAFDKTSHHTAQSVKIASSEGEIYEYFLIQEKQGATDLKQNFWCRVVKRADGAGDLDCSENVPNLNVSDSKTSNSQNQSSGSLKVSSRNGILTLTSQSERRVEDSTKRGSSKISSYELKPINQYPFGLTVQPEFYVISSANDVVKKDQVGDVYVGSTKAKGRTIRFCEARRIRESHNQFGRNPPETATPPAAATQTPPAQ